MTKVRLRLRPKVCGLAWARLLENDMVIESSECIFVVYRGIQRHDAEISSLRAFGPNLSSKETAEKKLEQGSTGGTFSCIVGWCLKGSTSIYSPLVSVESRRVGILTASLHCTEHDDDGLPVMLKQRTCETLTREVTWNNSYFIDPSIVPVILGMALPCTSMHFQYLPKTLTTNAVDNAGDVFVPLRCLNMVGP